MEPQPLPVPPAPAPPVHAPPGFFCTHPECKHFGHPFNRQRDLKQHLRMHEWVPRRSPCDKKTCKSQRSFTMHLVRCTDARCIALRPPPARPPPPRVLYVGNVFKMDLQEPAAIDPPPVAVAPSSSPPLFAPVPLHVPIPAAAPKPAPPIVKIGDAALAHELGESAETGAIAAPFSPPLSPLLNGILDGSTVSPLPSLRDGSPAPHSPRAMRFSETRCSTLPTVPSLFDVILSPPSRFHSVILPSIITC